MKIPSTQGYPETAEALVPIYESRGYIDVHRQVAHLFPKAPGTVLDIGAGTGRDAAGFAAIGHKVIAVEPVDEFRLPAARRHPDPAIEWVDDCLPHLSKIAGRAKQFDLIIMTAVWMHLDATERKLALPIITSLLKPEASLVLTLRHGPVPAGRRMFNVTASETIALAKTCGLAPTLCLLDQASSGNQPDVTWTKLAFAQSNALA
ncbi:class I SAM-dependent methyltransferase [Devosia rhodophyticola]|uniref:Class I SAM-dependent methyltransferase n=1 Tax=Devosia rhodophyticola TaxID=3026423 RepID=A0ABY7YW34_9HYPH|nr:class I SAM-dependent methyltransferase [Devosia rhodophyticola]WDR05070.1 class I SAM-dependent methyltransferase [Devosia rhodophyticola]